MKDWNTWLNYLAAMINVAYASSFIMQIIEEGHSLLAKAKDWYILQLKGLVQLMLLQHCTAQENIWLRKKLN